MGPRLKAEMLYFRIHGKNIAELSAMDIGELATIGFKGSRSI
jgi:excinuclease UvrABC ATPase subunit